MKERECDQMLVRGNVKESVSGWEGVNWLTGDTCIVGRESFDPK